MGRSVGPGDIATDIVFADALASGSAPRLVSDNSRVKDAIRNGGVYPMCDFGRHGDVAVLYVAEDRRLAVVVRMHLGEERSTSRVPLTFCGLDPMLRYTARLTCGGSLPDGMPRMASGAYYMSHRFDVALGGDVRGAALILDAGQRPQ